MALQSLSAAELTRLGGLKERCSASLHCVTHGCAIPCDACEVEETVGVVCSACGHYFAEGVARESNRACHSVAEFSRTGKIAFADSANEALQAQESEQQRQEDVQRQANELARLKRERAETERAEAARRDRLERERVQREKADSERREQVERERISRERGEAERREQLERERLQKEQAESEHQRQIERKGFERKLGAGVWVVFAIAAIWYLVGSGSKEKQTPLATPAPPSQVPSAAQSIGAAAPATRSVAPNLGALVQAAALSNRSGIESVLSVAETGSSQQIESAARDAGRAYSFSAESIRRDRKRARPLNVQALQALNNGSDAHDVYKIQQQAFQADPLDPEIAGNLAIYALRAGRTAMAQELALYALSLPRREGKTGRTADWATLAATYATMGEHQKASAALYVTLGIASDVAKRCYSAVYSVKNTYGPALKQATEAMFERIRDQGLSNAGECALPISW